MGQGETELFSVLVERHQDRLVGLCQRLLLDRQAALDAAQEVFLKAFHKASSVRPRGQYFTWLYRVATNHCLNVLRRRKIVRFLPFVDSQDEGAGVPWEPVDRGPNPEEMLAARRRWQRTAAAIRRLPESQRAVLVLAKFEGLSYREIAETLEITEGAVESRLFRAMRNLQRVETAQDSGESSVSTIERPV